MCNFYRALSLLYKKLRHGQKSWQGGKEMDFSEEIQYFINMQEEIQHFYDSRISASTKQFLTQLFEMHRHTGGRVR